MPNKGKHLQSKFSQIFFFTVSATRYVKPIKLDGPDFQFNTLTAMLNCHKSHYLAILTDQICKKMDKFKIPVCKVTI